MALSGLDIYKLLPKTNCRECGFQTCLAFAMQLAKKAVPIDKCPYVSNEAKEVLEASSKPPIKLVSIGTGQEKFETGNETVLFRHEEKFRNPCGIGYIIEDKSTDSRIKEDLAAIAGLDFERVGQRLAVNLVAVRQCGAAKRFIEALKLVTQASKLPVVLMSDDVEALREALALCAEKRPLIYKASKDNLARMAELVKTHKLALVISASDLDEAAALSAEASRLGVSELVIEVPSASLVDRIWELTQVRRLALKRSMRVLGFPVLACVENEDPYEEAMEVSSYICKYAGILLLSNIASWQALGLLTLRQNIYTDPQKPLQVDPKIYSVGRVNDKSPLLITTNFSLSYYTVLGEVEASKVPSFIMSVDTEGMSVLTAWAAEKFNAEIIAKAMQKMAAQDLVKNKRAVIPGYLAVMSGDLEDQSGWEVIVGPKEAAGLPSFLKNL